jgi:hypothetical protein
MKLSFAKGLYFAVIVLMLVIVIYDRPVAATDAETKTGASVEVLPGEDFTWGARVVTSRSVMFPGWALGEPDNRCAFMVVNGWISLEMENTVGDAAVLTVWAASRGWQPSNIKIFFSPDGRQWKLAGVEKARSSRIARYDITGNFGKIRYIKIDRNGGRWSWLLLDAVGAKGGDTGTQGKVNKKK